MTGTSVQSDLDTGC